MQSYRSDYSSSEYYNSSMSGDGHDYEYGAHNMTMAGCGRKQARHRYKESQALSNYGMDHYGMNRAGCYGENGHAYNSTGSLVPYSAGVDYMNPTQYQMSKANTHYAGGYGGGHYLAKQKQQQRLQYGGMEYNAMNQQQMHHHKRSEKHMVRKMNAMSMYSSSCTTSRGINHNKGNYSDDDEYCTSSGSDDDDDNFGGDNCEDYDSRSDYERRRNYRCPKY